jgi:hypothetical protein
MGAVACIFCPRCEETVDQHGVCGIPAEIAPKIPDAVSRIEATERRIISLCQSPDFSVERLKALYKEIRPGTY